MSPDPHTESIMRGRVSKTKGVPKRTLPVYVKQRIGNTDGSLITSLQVVSAWWDRPDVEGQPIDTEVTWDADGHTFRLLIQPIEGHKFELRHEQLPL